MEPRLTLVTLGVRDLARAVAFYRDGLGLEKDERWDEIAFFKMGTVILALFPRDELAADAHVSPEGSGFSGVTLAHNVTAEPRSMPCSIMSGPSEERSSRRPNESPGAVIPAILLTPMAISGRSPIAPVFSDVKS